MVSVINSAGDVLVALMISLPYGIVFELPLYHLDNGSMPGLWRVLD
jgi:hypothetical protein